MSNNEKSQNESKDKKMKYVSLLFTKSQERSGYKNQESLEGDTGRQKKEKKKAQERGKGVKASISCDKEEK